MKGMQAYLNIFKLRLNMALKREVIHNYPIAAYIEPTLFCNLCCPACPTGLRLGLRPSVAIKEDLLRSVIEEIGDYIFYLNMYNWGEPLLHKQTPEMIRYAKGKGIDIILSTNLSMKLTGDYIERLVRSGLDTLVVSLDGATENTYKKYRRGGDFALVRENMLRTQRAKAQLGSKTPCVVWQFLVFRHNEHEIERVLAEYKSWGADSVAIAGAQMPFEPYDEGFEPSIITQYNMYHPDHPYQRATERQMKSGCACSWLYGYFVLNPNGKVSPCCAVAAEKHDFGEYLTSGDFFQVWNSSKFRRARALFAHASKRSSNKRITSVQKQVGSARLEGMAAKLSRSLEEDELICRKCPIPFRQRDIDDIIIRIANGLAHSFLQEASTGNKTRYLLAYLLMGAPNWRELGRRGVRKIGGYLWSFWGRRSSSQVLQEG